MPSTHYQIKTNYLSHDWGTAHSSAGDDSKKAPWDAEEIADLRERHDRIAQSYPGGKIPMHASVVPQLLKAIHADPKAWPIYAKRHILDSGRLTTGFLSFHCMYLNAHSPPLLTSFSYFRCQENVGGT
jgi:hypothetical protein